MDFDTILIIWAGFYLALWVGSTYKIAVWDYHGITYSIVKGWLFATAVAILVGFISLLVLIITKAAYA